MTEVEKVEQVARSIEGELDTQEMLLADPMTLRRLKARRIARAAITTLSAQSEPVATPAPDLVAAVEHGKALGRKEALDAMAATFAQSSDPGVRLLSGLVNTAMANTASRGERA